MTEDKERWAEASAVYRLHGAESPVFVAARIGALAAARDAAGVRRWTEIAARLDQIMRASEQ